MMIKALIAAVVLLALLMSLFFEPARRRQRLKRIDALRQGAREAYFEELRALETYPNEMPVQWPWICLRIFIAVLGLSLLIKF